MPFFGSPPALAAGANTRGFAVSGGLVVNNNVIIKPSGEGVYLEVANAAAVIANNTTKYLEVANASAGDTSAVFANVNPRIISVVSTAATANTKAVQALADAAAANTRAEGARTIAATANTRAGAGLTIAATANTKAVQALADAAAANTRAEGARTIAATANTRAGSALAIAATANTTATNALPKSGGTLTGAVSFGDSIKANFGADSDLQIYHDGDSSFIDDQGTGTIRVKTNGLIIKDASNSNQMAVFSGAGNQQFYHNNTLRLTVQSSGIDVNGTVEADGATFKGAVNINAPLNLTTYTESVNTSTVSSGTTVLNLTDDTVFNLTLNSGTQIQFTNAPAAKAVSVTLVCKQDGTGNRQLTYANNVVFTDGNVPTMSSTGGDFDVITFLTVDGGGTYLGSHSILSAR